MTTTSTSRSSSPQSIDRNYAEELQEFIAGLLLQPDHEPVASELKVLQSIYGDDAIRLWQPSTGQYLVHRIGDNQTVRYEAVLSLPTPHEDVTIRVLVSLPPSYPSTSPPQLQLLSRYIGAFGADANLFGSILRTFISTNGVEWTADTVCVFDGLQSVLDRCVKWYEDRVTAEKVGDLVREDARDHPDTRSNSPILEVEERTSVVLSPIVMPKGIQIFEAEAIIDRKSAFVGRACRIFHPSEVPLVLTHLMSDRQIFRAAHPIINAWRCQVGNLLHQGENSHDRRARFLRLKETDNDDDGETAAGGHLAHLLQILEVNNVLVIVTRYFGGIHLGPDRFKHINQAARNALELGGFLDAVDSKKNIARGKKR